MHKPAPGDAKDVPVVEYGLSDAFREFCHDAFNVRMPLEYPPLKLRTVGVADELPQALFEGGDPRKGMTECGRDVCLFLASPLASYVSGATLLVHGGGETPAFLAARET